MTSRTPATVRPPSTNTFQSLTPGTASRPPPIQTQGTSSSPVEIDDRPVKRRRLEELEDVSLASLQPTLSNQNLEEHVAEEDNGAKYIHATWLHALYPPPEKTLSQSDEETYPPLPQRPWNSDLPGGLATTQNRDPCRKRADVPVPTSPDSIQASGTNLPPDRIKPPGYFPWTGKHPEDVLSEPNVTRGYFDRPPNPAEKELNTAKAPLYNAFKHRSGVESLSALFSLVLEQKNKHNALNTSSTFKPPARVTLTEAKRKSWIADLANPDVPLRRLSRTIPQGVRGQVLLEQCLIHSVPLNRAVWFMKCVGAIDVRTLRRKGVNSSITAPAESKWLKDWTAGIEQFLDSLLSQPMQPSWQSKIYYSLRLSTRLYNENMLDRDHYLDWVVKSTTVADLNTLPFWLMIIHLQEKDLFRFRKRAKQLVQTLSAKLIEMLPLPAKIWEPLRTRLESFLRNLVFTTPASFLIPGFWNQCEKVLDVCLDKSVVQERQTYENIKSSNLRAMGLNPQQMEPATPGDQLVYLLDDAAVPFNISTLAAKLQETSADTKTVLQTCLDWAVSKYRASSQRIHLVARLLRKWQKDGLDADGIIRSYLLQQKDELINPKALRHLFAELSRSKTFSLSRYLQGLTVCGFPAISESSDPESLTSVSIDKNDEYCALRLRCLPDASVVNAPEYVANLRTQLLERAGFDTEKEQTNVETFLDNFTRSLEALDRHEQINFKDEFVNLRVPDLSWNMRMWISYRVRQEIATYAKTASIEIPGKPSLPGARTFSISHFKYVRSILESLEDIPVLADILHVLSNSKQEQVLAACVDTINYHAEILSAIGALQSLQTLYCEAYVSLRAAKPSILLFTTSLMDLCRRFPHERTPIRLLRQDFARGDRGRAVAACSPFSEGVAESLQQAGATFLDDFEAILQAETHMSEQTMVSLFTVLIDRISKIGIGKDEEDNLFLLCQLLTRLKMFRQTQGEALIQKWLARWLFTTSGASCKIVLRTLCSCRCVSIENLIDLTRTAPQSTSARVAVDELVISSVVAQDGDIEDAQLSYATRLSTQHLTRTRPSKVLDILVNSPGHVQLGGDMLKSLVFPIITNEEPNGTETKDWLPKLVARIYVESKDQIPNPVDLVCDTNALSLPVHRFLIQDYCRSISETGSENSISELASAIFRCLGDQQLYSSSKESLLNAAGPEVGAKIRQMADQAFIDSLPKFLQTKIPGPPVMPTVEETQRSEAAIQRVVMFSKYSDYSASVAGGTVLIEKLNLLMKYMGNKVDVGSVPSTLTTPITPVQNVQIFPSSSGGINLDTRTQEALVESMDYFRMLLQFACLKRPAYIAPTDISQGSVAKQIQQEQIKLTALITAMAVSPALSQLQSTLTDESQRRKVVDTINFAQDVAATFVDDMSDDSRLICSRVLKDRLRDERVQWLVGSVNMLGSLQGNERSRGLQIVHESKGVLGEFRPKVWEMLESGAGAENDTWLGLGLFGATRV